MWIGLGIRITNWWRRVANGPFNNHATLTNGLVSYWKLDEQSGTRYDSITATGNDLTDNNTVTYVNAGPAGVSAKFTSANNESLSHIDSTDFNPAAFSIAMWVKGGAATEYLISKCATGSTTDSTFWASCTGATTYTVALGDGAGHETTSGLTVGSAADWNFLVFGWDGTQLIYSLNGAVISGQGAWGFTPVDNTADFKLGRFAGLDVLDYNGQMANVGFWSRALTSADTLSLYNTGVGKAYANLTAADKVSLTSYWNLDEASGTRADSHGSNTLTDNNTVTSATNDAPPPKNAAAYFTRANSEYLTSAASRASLQVGVSNFTWSGWVKFTSFPTATSNGIISKGPQTDYGIDISESGGNTTFRGYTSNGGGFPIAASAAISLSTWYHFIFWRDSSDTKNHLSINGVETASSAAAIVSTDTTAALFLGSFTGGNVNSLDGALDEVGFWNRKLTAQERSDLWNSGDGLYYDSTGIDTTPYYLLLEDGGKIILEDGSGFLLK